MEDKEVRRFIPKTPSIAITTIPISPNPIDNTNSESIPEIANQTVIVNTSNKSNNTVTQTRSGRKVSKPMPRKRVLKTNRVLIDEANMKQAIIKVFNSTYSERRAAIIYKIRRTTLQCRIKRILSKYTKESYLTHNGERADDSGNDSIDEDSPKYSMSSLQCIFVHQCDSLTDFYCFINFPMNTIKAIEKILVPEENYTTNFTTKNHFLKKPYTGEEEIEYVRALKYDNLTIEEIISHYNKCRNTRLSQIKACQDMKEVYASWPHYKQSYGYKLIYKEFDTFFEKLLPVLKQKITDLESIKLFTQLDVQRNSLTEDGRNAGLLYLLPIILPPTTRSVVKVSDGTKRIKRFTT
ncbi:hypothetical protein RN001_002410 [Aquatica leii]|uniref:Uncharacterized protein n=1 Tax=Aquatica leii TaxID=1421715 RepID=A0AAN7SLT7_9COLE|nr:hypothetical protein RN001_002410 [Aquatica leii]